MARIVKRARKAKASRKAKSVKTAKKAATITKKKKSPQKPARSTARLAKAAGPANNRAILALLIGGDFPDTQELAPLGFDDLGSKQGLAASIRARGVRVSNVDIVVCDTVGDVLGVMGRSPGGH